MSVGQTISGRYAIYRKLGRGGMGDVYAATDLQLERKVALKAIRSEFRLDPAARARFLREARALSKLEHESICRIHDYIAAEDQDYLVLELIEGESLRERLVGGLEKAEAFRFAEQIGDALAMAHAEGLVHRDLKPGNVMITEDGNAKILDFGLARSAVEAAVPAPAPDARPPVRPGDDDEPSEFSRTVTSLDSPTLTPPDSVTVVGHAVGTPRYMSPEQARGEEVGSASDMFSFGLLLHEMFTDRPDRTAARGLDRHLKDLIERLESAAASRRPTAVDAAARLRWIRTKPQRQLRWAIGVAAVFVTIGAGVKYTLDLRHERAAAEFRRNQSDQHIEFMVEELYKKLEPVGRVDILEEVGVKALEYFETLSEDETTDDDRARLGRTWTQIGHVRLASGDFDGATAAFERSLAIHQGLVDIVPTRGDWLIGLSGAHFGIGNISLSKGDVATAAEHFGSYMDVSKTLVGLDPANPTYRLELGYALTNLAGLHGETGESTKAADELRQAVELKQGLLDTDPDNRDYRISLANTLEWIADVTEDMRNYEEALGHAKAAVALRRTLADDVRDSRAQQQLSVGLQQLGRLFSRSGRSEQAEAAYREDIAISMQLAQLDPGNRDWQLGLATSWHTLGAFYVEHERYDDARPLLEKSLGELTALLAIDRGVADWRDEFFVTRYTLAKLEFLQDRPREAIRVLTDGSEAERSWRGVRDSILLSEIQYRLGNRDAAGATLARAARDHLESPNKGNSQELARVRALIGTQLPQETR